jgi:hypothetical protein
MDKDNYIHNIKNILNLISSYSQLIELCANDKENNHIKKLILYSTEIKKNTSFLINIINNSKYKYNTKNILNLISLYSQLIELCVNYKKNNYIEKLILYSKEIINIVNFFVDIINKKEINKKEISEKYIKFILIINRIYKKNK